MTASGSGQSKSKKKNPKKHLPHRKFRHSEDYGGVSAQVMTLQIFGEMMDIDWSARRVGQVIATSLACEIQGLLIV